MTNFCEEDFFINMMKDLTRLRATVKRRLCGGQLIDTMETICGGSYNIEKAENTVRSGWEEDPVHANARTFAKMALHLIERLANYEPITTAAAAGHGTRGRKRKLSEFEADYSASSSQRGDTHASRRTWTWRERGKTSGPPVDGGRGGGWRGDGHRRGSSRGGGHDRQLEHGYHGERARGAQFSTGGRFYNRGGSYGVRRNDGGRGRGSGHYRGGY